MRPNYKWLLAFCLVLLCLLAGCSRSKNREITTLEQLREPGRRIGVCTNCPEEALVVADFPQAEIAPYSDAFPAYADVANGRLDAMVYQRRSMELAIENGTTGVRLLDLTYNTNIIAIPVSPVTPIPDFLEKLNRFIGEVKANGTLDEMYDRWVVQGNHTMPDIPQPENPAFRLRVATTGTVEPYTYYVGSELRGFDIELSYRLAAWLGAELEFKVYDFSGAISALQGGDADCLMSNMYYTPGRNEAIPFSDPLFEVENTIMVRTGDNGIAKNFLLSLQNSFEKTFLREDRWKLFAQGLCTTLVITVLSILLGTGLGFGMFLLCRKGNPLANGLTRFLVWLIHGMPMVVLLMILYYVVFGKIEISGAAVAVIGFTLVFGGAVQNMLSSGVGAVDRGQTEAAYALGYTDNQAFFRVVLPQALPHIYPTYKGEITATVKATAIVGYVAVQDLTKMGDIVRSRTYEAFFPLIAVAIIYFLLSGLLTAAVDHLVRLLDKKRQDQFLGGVMQV